MRPRDTSPEAWNVLMDLLRKIPPEEKLRRALALTEAARKLSETGLREVYPDAGERRQYGSAERRDSA